jgi:DNA-binding NtrC family response regulator
VSEVLLAMSPRYPLVLIVEDEPLIRELAGIAITDAGFEVVEAGNAQEALEILDARNDVGVLCTDVDMPGALNGLQLASLVHERWPEIRLVVTSGRPLPAPVPDDGRFLSKPYSLQALTQTVADVSEA